MTEHSEDFGQVFDETSLHQAIIKTWGEHGAHNDVLTAMRHHLRSVEAENERLRKALELACEDGWDDGQWAMRRYLEMAQAHLSGSSGGEG